MSYDVRLTASVDQVTIATRVDRMTPQDRPLERRFRWVGPEPRWRRDASEGLIRHRERGTRCKRELQLQKR